jgi:hypothetical protein
MTLCRMIARKMTRSRLVPNKMTLGRRTLGIMQLIKLIFGIILSFGMECHYEGSTYGHCYIYWLFCWVPVFIPFWIMSFWRTSFFYMWFYWMYTMTILHWLLIYTYTKHSLLQTFEKALSLQSFERLSDIRIKAFTILFKLRHSVYLKPKPTLLGASLSVVNNFKLQFHWVLII